MSHLTEEPSPVNHDNDLRVKIAYDAEIDYVLNILSVVLGKERFGRFAEFIDNDDCRFAEMVAKKDSTINPENYGTASSYKEEVEEDENKSLPSGQLIAHDSYGNFEDVVIREGELNYLIMIGKRFQDISNEFEFSPPDWFDFSSVAGLNPCQWKAFIEELMEKAKAKAYKDYNSMCLLRHLLGTKGIEFFTNWAMGFSVVQDGKVVWQGDSNPNNARY